jgi:hypothetical protein
LQVLTLEQLEEGFRGNRGSKESLLVDVAAKNLLKTLVATFCGASCYFYPPPQMNSARELLDVACQLIQPFVNCDDHMIAPAPSYL